MATDPVWRWNTMQRLKPGGGLLWWESLDREFTQIVRGIEHPVVLDVGCGCQSLLHLGGDSRPGFRVGIDVDREAAGNPLLDRFVRGDAGQLPVRSGSVDLLIAGYLVEHLREPRAAFREFFRAMKPGATAIIWTPNLLNYAILFSAVTPTWFHNWARRRAFPEDKKENVPTYYRANTSWALVRALRDAGLEVSGGVCYGGGSYQYWGFSKALYVVAVLASHAISRGPLRCLENALVVRCVKRA